MATAFVKYPLKIKPGFEIIGANGLGCFKNFNGRSRQTSFYNKFFIPSL